jgi:hypothetical protein
MRDKKWLHEIKIPRQAIVHRQQWNFSPSASKEWVLTQEKGLNAIQDLTIQRFVEPLKKILIQSK